MSTTKEEPSRNSLIQGTLDHMILRALVFGRPHGQGIARAIQQNSAETSRRRHSARAIGRILGLEAVGT